MNNRVKEIYKEAFGVGLSINNFVLEENEKKFAELIVQECIAVCKEQHDPQNLNYKPSESFAEAIRLHFGVKGN
jgi:hypothetical protein